jgi:hypothetical protein
VDEVTVEMKYPHGPCEFARGVTTFNPAPVVELCRKPGIARRGITWAEVIACDECYGNWLNRTRDE